MADRDTPLLDEAKREIASLADDLKQMAELRSQLAMLELRTAAGQVKRLAIVAVAAAVAALTALPILAVYAAELLDQRLGIPRSGWLLIFGVGLLAVAMLSGWLAARRFRREFVGMEETLEELREDLVWLGEWREKRGEG